MVISVVVSLELLVSTANITSTNASVIHVEMEQRVLTVSILTLVSVFPASPVSTARPTSMNAPLILAPMEVNAPILSTDLNANVQGVITMLDAYRM